MEIINFINSLEITYQGGCVFLDLIAWITLIRLVYYEVINIYNKNKGE